MINLNDKLNLEGYGLLLQNNELTITKTLQNEYIIVDDNLTINVLEDVSVNILDKKAKKALVIVRDDQFSLAIGKGGQNVRLASFAIDWHIDIKRFSDAIKEGISFTYNVIQK